jgi:hypothetical protein
VGFEKMVRSAGIAPASPDWQPGILLLDDDRKWAARAEVPAPHTTKKEQTPLPSLLKTPTGFLGGSFGVSGTPPAKPSN